MPDGNFIVAEEKPLKSTLWGPENRLIGRRRRFLSPLWGSGCAIGRPMGSRCARLMMPSAPYPAYEGPEGAYTRLIGRISKISPADPWAGLCVRSDRRSQESLKWVPRRVANNGDAECLTKYWACI